MSETKMPPMKTPVHTLPRGDETDAKHSASVPHPSRDQRMSRVIDARRRLEGKDDAIPPQGGGRAWINGREVGGPDSRYAHLSATYD